MPVVGDDLQIDAEYYFNKIIESVNVLMQVLPQRCSSVGRVSFKRFLGHHAALVMWVQNTLRHKVVGKVLAAPSVTAKICMERCSEKNDTGMM